MLYRTILTACCLLILSASFVVAEPLSPGSTPFKVNTSIKPPFSTKDGTGFFDLLIQEIGKRMVLDVKVVRQPPARALCSVNEGFSDAELPRIAGLEKKYPNLIRVEEKIIDYNFVAFMRGPEGKHMSHWDDMADKRVGYLVGWKIFENNVPKEVYVNKLNKPALLFDMLDSGRIDVALYERYAGWNNIRSYAHMGIHECTPPLAVKPMYMYFHNSHAHLAPLAAEVLRKMKADGTYNRIKERTLGN